MTSKSDSEMIRTTHDNVIKYMERVDNHVADKHPMQPCTHLKSHMRSSRVRVLLLCLLLVVNLALWGTELFSEKVLKVIGALI